MAFQNKIIASLSLAFFFSYSVFFTNVQAQTEGKIEPKIEGVKNKETPQNIFETLTPLTQYPDGVYSGGLTFVKRKFTQREDAKKPYDKPPPLRHKKWRLRLYIQGQQRLYYFLDGEKQLVYKLLYYHPKPGQLGVLAWDPKRDIIHAPRKNKLYQRVLQTGFHYTDLALQPYKEVYMNQKPPQNKNQNDSVLKRDGFTAKANANQEISKSLPLNLLPLLPLNIQAHTFQPRLLGRYDKVIMQIESPQNTTLHSIDFFAYPQLLKRSLFFTKDHQIYNYATQKKEKIVAHTSFKALDFERDTISLLEFDEYDSRKKIKPALFNPRFIRYQ